MDLKNCFHMAVAEYLEGPQKAWLTNHNFSNKDRKSNINLCKDTKFVTNSQEFA